jgi:hypothetical protein
LLRRLPRRKLSGELRDGERAEPSREQTPAAEAIAERGLEIAYRLRDEEWAFDASGFASRAARS